MDQKTTAATDTKCLQCGNDNPGKYCADCGQAAQVKRIDKHYISHELFHLLHFEKGFFYTVKQLATHPGSSIREFIERNRNKHMKPVPFLVLTSLLYTLIAHALHVNDLTKGKQTMKISPTTGAMLNWVQGHFGYANIIMGICIALCLQLLFRKYRHNFFEILILLCFVMGQGMLLLALVTCCYKILSPAVYMTLFSVAGFAYPVWAIGEFFDKTKVGSYVKALIAYFLGYILFYVGLIIIGVTIDVLMKHG